MRWFFYSAKDDMQGRSVEKLLREYVPSEQLERAYGIDGFANYFKSSTGNPSHALLVLNDSDDLNALGPYKRFIADTKCLIALTDRLDHEISDQAIEFRPRFIAYLPGDFGHLELILQKMTSRPPKSLLG